jgi:hypothetical protein
MLGNFAAIIMVLVLLKVLGWAFERPWVGWVLFILLSAGGVVAVERLT